MPSGTSRTPIVRSDLDGDGRANDRAFVPNPTNEPDATTRTQMQSLLAIGRRRTTMNIVFENPLAGLDQMLHGAEKLRGCGTQAVPDPVLLLPRGYDAAARRQCALWRYARVPYAVARAVPCGRRLLGRFLHAIQPVRTSANGKRGWSRRSADSIAALYLDRTSNLHRLLLSESDSHETLLAALLGAGRPGATHHHAAAARAGPVAGQHQRSDQRATPVPLRHNKPRVGGQPGSGQISINRGG